MQKKNTSKIKTNKRWVLINKNCELVGRLDYNPENTRASARKWFYNTKKLVNQHGDFDEFFRVLNVDEFDEIKKESEKGKSIPSKLNRKKRIRFVSPKASIYSSSSKMRVESKTDIEKEKIKFLEFIARAPISFRDEDEFD